MAITIQGLGNVAKTAFKMMEKEGVSRQIIVSPKTGTVVQKMVGKDCVAKAISFGEGTPMRKLGITDAILTMPKTFRWGGKGDGTKKIEFFRNTTDLQGTFDSRGWETLMKGQQDLFCGSPYEAKEFIKVLKGLNKRGIELFG